MKDLKLILPLCGICLFLFPAPAHAAHGRCESCHVGLGSDRALLSRDINVLCSGCHQDRIRKGEHKVGISPSTIVRGLPLHNGLLTCATCHDPHTNSYKLLRKKPEELCVSCHDK